mmetsp:Transcript_13825/g.13610  ORF Transcript_13825/g.13610 Transcript_13825/m.13610 type:complete len:119 (-) Transcript_13825:160-516(-)
MIGDRQPWAAWAFVVVMATTALLHFRINLILSRMESLIMTLLIYFSPMSAGVAATFDYAGQTMIGKAVALVSFILNALWVYFSLLQPRKLPLMSPIPTKKLLKLPLGRHALLLQLPRL